MDKVRNITDDEYDIVREKLSYDWRGKDRKHLNNYPPDQHLHFMMNMMGLFHEKMKTTDYSGWPFLGDK